MGVWQKRLGKMVKHPSQCQPSPESENVNRVTRLTELTLAARFVLPTFTCGTPARRVSEQLQNDDREEQELDEVEGESRGADDVVEVPLVQTSFL